MNGNLPIGHWHISYVRDKHKLVDDLSILDLECTIHHNHESSDFSTSILSMIYGTRDLFLSQFHQSLDPHFSLDESEE